MTLRVAESASGSSASAGAGAGDKAELRRAFERRAQAARRAEKWADRAMEEILPRDVFLQALTYLHRASYAEVTHERHLNGLCAYAPCDRPPAAPYRARRRFVVSTATRSITEREGNEDQAYCSRVCAARSAYVAGQLGTAAPWLGGGGGGGIVLLEDVEEREKADAEKAEMETEDAGKAEQAEKAEKAEKTDTPLPSLLASLSIVERATPTLPPNPPGHGLRLPVEPGPPVAVSSGGDGLPLPLPGGEAVPSLLSKAKATTGGAPTTRRGASSLLSTEHAGLANSVVSASQKLRPESSDESEDEEEWAKAMGWGAGPEVDALFAVAAESRRLMQEEGDGGEQPASKPT
ncbi:hypothetical protein CC85DRAFT_286454 [Cutaneotrichosporon oleaginosum]|uniref:RNA polymerase II subunit B1 CTD phosphatase RPAP2 homolog n=1 Tax=Cutaneotrichosporon oleaginosum TaxID=879819 RepID=A0A0J1B1F3_9TREE|nr:uncharacterized protein CC85DRAFT_286454 [Cutaneotrichosporon oleaginosum]KLT41424.1 hypothetical protein CC85DRAFT_286454 [Cutaneotrichosporon oleaginosum]TXT12186.1 hypothetical protein COLE_02596 [Cutaneotrichosporon oleaginosum]